ncbi:unnamed protein product [Orchesella dallaii]|uniref:Uncharacterized protein n=1 Tax=Orchesella dallaii TaxID=48710 RepID=A0ABP1R6J1_9HEXA
MNSSGTYGYYPPNYVTAYDSSGLYLTRDYFRIVAEKWWQSQNLFNDGTPIMVDGVLITPKYNALQSVIWDCGCNNCVMSVHNFLEALIVTNGKVGATISSYGPNFSNILTSGRFPQVRLVTGSKSTGMKGSAWRPENEIVYASMNLPLAPGGGNGSGLLPTPLPTDYMGMGQQGMMPGANGYGQGNNYPNGYTKAVPTTRKNQGKSGGQAAPKNAGFADTAAKSKVNIDNGNDQR